MQKFLFSMFLIALNSGLIAQELMEETELEGYFVLNSRWADSEKGFRTIFFIEELNEDSVKSIQYLNSLSYTSHQIMFDSDTSAYHELERPPEDKASFGKAYKVLLATDANKEQFQKFLKSGILNAMADNEKVLEKIMASLPAEAVKNKHNSVQVVKGSCHAFPYKKSEHRTIYNAIWNDSSYFEYIGGFKTMPTRIKAEELEVILLNGIEHFIYPASVELVEASQRTPMPDKDGFYVVFYEKPNIRGITFRVLNGQYEGPMIKFERDGSIMQEIMFKNGRIIRNSSTDQ